MLGLDEAAFWAWAQADGPTAAAASPRLVCLRKFRLVLKASPPDCMGSRYAREGGRPGLLKREFSGDRVLITTLAI
jgi:hypothetical protein